MIITKTPFRMSFFGGGTDMPSFFRENGGSVLSTTFDKYCYVNVRHLPRFFDYSTELSYSKTERVTNIEDIQHPAIRNAMKFLDMHEIRLTYEADLPARSGLGTSSSFAVGMLNAFYEIVELIVDTICSEQEFIRIGGDRKSRDVVKSQFLKLNSEHIRFVLKCLKENTSKVINIRQYLLTVLYNAPLTISNYYSALVQHDMYGTEP